MTKKPTDPVTDDEVLFRRVMAGYNLYRKEGELIYFSAQPFNDRVDQPSVDRAEINGNDPQKTQISTTDGVTQIIAGEIRNETVVCANGTVEYLIDVIEDPIFPPNDPVNLAHAVIAPNPEYQNGSHFKKVKEYLARLASKRGFIIDPIEPPATS